MSDETLGPGESSVSDETLAADVTLQSTDGRDGDARVRDPSRRGALVDRYVVLDLAGAGGMGLVLAAYDPQLDRKVAVKLLKVGSEPAQARLQREAQALAKLDHPNVVGVYDVGKHEGQLFMAMEFVEGTTLSKWIHAHEHPHAWREVVRIFVEAGRGLAAAHAVGLVHRDFKPENVMIGRDGRVRVMDFGLARATTLHELELEATPNAATRPAVSLGALTLDMTRTGALMGTPAYMSPEQFAGKPADERSDQFGFCVALYEALYGKRPFAGASMLELIMAVTEGRMQPTPPHAKVPPWLRRVVLRGLSQDPQQRWPSMNALLAALADDPSLRRRRWWLGGAAATLLGLSTSLVVWAMQNDETCEGLDAPLAGVWDDARRSEVEAAILATKVAYAPGTWERVAPLLDAYAGAWHRERIDACEDSARGEQSSELLDLRMICLDRRLTHLSATIDVLAHADAAAVEHALDAIERLPALDACSDRDALLHDDRPTRPELATALESVERRRIAAETSGVLGRSSQALELMRPLVAEADALGDQATRARTYLTLARMQQYGGDYQDAELALRESYRAAMLAGQPRQAAAAARMLVEIVGGGTGLARASEGRAWAFHAEVLTAAAGTRLDQADYAMDIGELEKVSGNYPAARESFERALAIYDELDSDLTRRVEAISSLANVENFMGEVEPSLAHYRRALQLLEAQRDPLHPKIAVLHMSLGDVYSQVGRWAEARTELEAAVAIFERALDAQHPTLGLALGVLGYVAGWQGDYVFARKTLERSVAIFEDSLGRDHYYYSDAVGKLGAVEYLAGDYAAAGEHYEFARASLERQMGADHPSVGIALVNLAELALTQKDYALALERADAALAILEPKIGSDHFDLLLPLETRGRALLELGRASEAIPTLERAIAIHEREHHDAEGLGKLRDALARANELVDSTSAGK